MTKKTYQKFAANCAIGAGVTGFLYALSFLIISRVNPDSSSIMSSLFLLLTGLLVLATQTGLYQRLRQTEETFALLALFLSLLGALGMIVHGGYDLANAINPPTENLPSLAGLPSQLDPRGLLSFGVGSMGLFLVSWLMAPHKHFPLGLSNLGYIAATLLAVLYLGRLIILDASNPFIALVAVISGFIVGPLWYIWLGLTLSND